MAQAQPQQHDASIAQPGHAVENENVHQKGFSRYMEAVARLKPPTFDGSGEPAAVTFWLNHFEKLLKGIRCPETEKVAIATYYLIDHASDWWDAAQPTDHEASWEEFRAKLEDMFFLEALRDAKLREFQYPKNEGLMVHQLALKFNQLLKYTGSMVRDEKDKMKHFHQWLYPEIKPLMAKHNCTTLEQYIDECLVMEAAIEESNQIIDARGGKRQKTQSAQGGAVPPNNSFKKPFPMLGGSQINGSSRSSQNGGSQMLVGQQQSRDQQGMPKVIPHCYNCRDSRHKKIDCTKAPQTCYQCGGIGYIKAFCRRGVNSVQSQASSPSFRTPST